MRGDPNAIIPPDSDVLVALRGIPLNENHRANLPGEMSHSVSNIRYLPYSPFLGVWHFSSSSTQSFARGSNSKFPTFAFGIPSLSPLHLPLCRLTCSRPVRDPGS